PAEARNDRLRPDLLRQAADRPDRAGLRDAACADGVLVVASCSAARAALPPRIALPRRRNHFAPAACLDCAVFRDGILADAKDCLCRLSLPAKSSNSSKTLQSRRLLHADHSIRAAPPPLPRRWFGAASTEEWKSKRSEDGADAAPR